MKVEPVAYRHYISDNEDKESVVVDFERFNAMAVHDGTTPLYAIPPGYALVRVEQVKDAERFDFLRKQTGSIRFGDHSLCGQFEGQRGLFNEFIDAAITAAKGE